MYLPQHRRVHNKLPSIIVICIVAYVYEGAKMKTYDRQGVIVEIHDVV